MANNSGNSFLAALAGIAIGIGAGILMAPDEGKNTRKKIKKSFDENTNELKERINKLSNEIKEKTKAAKGTFEENIEHLVSQSSYKAEEVIDILEKKLADLKETNAKFQK